jgi:transposase InsO family protein
MLILMKDTQLQTVDQVKEFLKGSEVIEFKGQTSDEKYLWTEEVLIKFKYRRLSKGDKGILRRYIEKVTGYSRSQVARLIANYKQTGRLQKTRYFRHCFPRKYMPKEIELLARTDELHGYLSGPATKKILQREYEVYGNNDFKRISRISVAHLYNQRKSSIYRAVAKRYTKTKPAVSRIGQRAKPDAMGQPGCVRVDTVHQGDLNGHKGVYHINAIDEVTQWEIVASVEKISEAYLVPVLGSMLEEFPFVVRGFHSDNGSEFVNHIVARLLHKMLIRFTKSRPRQSNDNGLVETKNGSVIRKQLGYAYIPQGCAELINQFNKDFFNLYINFHRPCFFPVPVTDSKGKVRKTYPYEEVRTPYEKLKSIPNPESYLRAGVTFNKLDAIAMKMSDNQFAERMVNAHSVLFKQISRFGNPVT